MWVQRLHRQSGADSACQFVWVFRCLCPSIARHSVLVASHRQLWSPLEILSLITGSPRTSYRCVSTAYQSQFWALVVAPSPTQRVWNREAQRHARLPLCPPKCSIVSFSRDIESSTPVSSSHSHPDWTWPSINVEIIPVVGCASPAEDKPAGAEETLVVLLLALPLVRSINSSSFIFVTVFSQRQSSCLCSIFPQWPQEPSNLELFSCLSLCFPLPLSLPFLPLLLFPFFPLPP